MVSVAIDFALLLAESGLDEPRLAIRGRDASGANGDVFHGDVSVFKARHVAVDVSMAGGSWRLGAQPGAPAGGVGAQRLWLIRGFGLSITLAALAWLTTRRRAPEAGLRSGAVAPARILDAARLSAAEGRVVALEEIA